MVLFMPMIYSRSSSDSYNRDMAELRKEKEKEFEEREAKKKYERENPIVSTIYKNGKVICRRKDGTLFEKPKKNNLDNIILSGE